MDGPERRQNFFKQRNENQSGLLDNEDREDYPQRSEHGKIPRFLRDNAYGDKTPVQIQTEIDRQKDCVHDLMEEVRTKHMDTDPDGKKRSADSMEANMLIYQIDALRKNIYKLRQYQKTAEHKNLCDMIKEGGNKFWNFLLSKGEPTHDNVWDFQYRDINAF
jgi:hypothetical protein